MRKETFLINNKELNYLIHGQPLSCQYKIPVALFVVVRYEKELNHNTQRLKWLNKKFYFLKSRGVFNTLTNAYSPKIEFYCFGLGIWKIIKNLKVNFVNVKLPDLKIEDKPLNLLSPFQIKTTRLHFELNKRFFSNVVFNKNSFSIIKKECQIKEYNDYELFKQNYKTN